MNEKIYDNLIQNFDLQEQKQIEEEIINQKIYERHFQVKNGDVVVDIGAHKGGFIKSILNKEPNIIYALEPSEKNVNYLSKIIENLNFSRKLLPTPINIKITKKVIYKTTGKVGYKTDGTFIQIDEKSNNYIDSISFKDFINQHNIKIIDFLKMDCETGEYYVINEENIDLFKNIVKKGVFELHLENEELKVKAIETINLLEHHNIPFIINSIDGVNITKENFLKNIYYYNEVLVYFTQEGTLKNYINIHINYLKGTEVEIRNPFPSSYLVSFWKDNGKNETTKLFFSKIIQNNQIVKCPYEYKAPWRINIQSITEKKDIYRNWYDYDDFRTILISFESKSLGDTLAWVPYVEEFRKLHKFVKIYCSTFWNFLFKSQYPEIEFIEPNQHVKERIDKIYSIGWFYNEDGTINKYKHPIDPKKRPLQATICDILDLEYKEIKPKIEIPEYDNIIKEPYVCIAIHSTAQAKYWNNPTGWQDVVDYLNSKGYKVILLSREQDGFMGNKHPNNTIQLQNLNIQQIGTWIQNSKLFIGIGSGLSWLSWSLNTPTILISGFSESYTEPQSGIIRINSPIGKCSGCFNKYKLNPNNWNWCPEHENTSRQFECTKSITGHDVIQVINNIL